MKRSRTLTLVALGALLLAAPAADAAKRTVPFGFHSVNFGSEIVQAPDATQDAQWARVASSGAESARVPFSWAEAQPTPGAVDLHTTDRLVSQSAAHGVRLLPVVVTTPPWARRDAAKGGSPPRKASDYIAFLDLLVRRYGPNGTLWSERPDLPKRPVREWQIWNEPHFREYWDASRWERGYHELLRASYKRLKQLDSGSVVVFGGVTGAAWEILERYYEKRGDDRRAYDVMAIHPYTRLPSGIPKIVRRTREAMRAHGDKSVPLWLTEFGWSASKGRVEAPKAIRGIQVSDKGLAERLEQGFEELARARKDSSTRVERAYWYTWSSSYDASIANQVVSIFSFSGLVRFAGGVAEEKPALAAYARSAKRYQGCTKTDLGRCAK